MINVKDIEDIKSNIDEYNSIQKLCEYVPVSNFYFIDEVIDTGMDSSGVENALAILKKMAREGNRSVWLVSHKDELAGRVNNVLSVVKENGFTTYNTDVEIS
jgi:ABC-type multidrug transport system ATPase subunit